MNLVNRNGTLWIDFYHQSERIRRSLELNDTKANRKYAQMKIIPELLYKLNSGEFFEKETTKAKIPIFSEYAEHSFALNKHRRKPVTHHDYYNSYKLHMLPYFGKKRLNEIKPSDISIWQNMLIEKFGIGVPRVKHLKTILSVIFEDAYKDEIITRNPTRLASSLPKCQLGKIEAFSMDEIHTILAHSNGQFRNFFAVGFFTGMRTGEIIGLRWEDVDFENKEINIQRTIGRGVVSTPKTLGSIRTIDILDPLLPFLQEQYALTGDQNSYVFLTINNDHYFDSKNIRDHEWKRTLKKAEVKYRTIYQMRHTFATMMIENGEDILWVSNMLGHTTAKMTLERYARYVKRKDKKRAEFLNENFGHNLVTVEKITFESA